MYCHKTHPRIYCRLDRLPQTNITQPNLQFNSRQQRNPSQSPWLDGGWRLITNLSAPVGNSFNSSIEHELCSVWYAFFDQAIQIILSQCKSSELCKMDLSSVFRLIPIHPSDFCLLGIFIDGKYYFDKCMPFSCAIACPTFELFSTLLHWLVSRRAGNDNIIHYLDDFLFIGKQKSQTCYNTVQVFQQTCQKLGVLINHNKIQGPCTKLTFLGLGIDTINYTMFIPDDKSIELKKKLTYVLNAKKVTLREIQALVGSLNCFVKTLPGSRAFNRRFYNATIGIKKPHHFIKITHTMKRDVCEWLDFLENSNGKTPFPELIWSNNDTFQLFTDSCGSCGGGAFFFNNYWTVLVWPSTWDPELRRDITYLELLPILVAIWLLSEQLAAKKYW